MGTGAHGVRSGDCAVKLTVGIPSECTCVSNHHFVLFECIIICQLFPSRAVGGGRNQGLGVPPLQFSFPECSAVMHSSRFHVGFRISLTISAKEMHLGSAGDCVHPVSEMFPFEDYQGNPCALGQARLE